MTFPAGFAPHLHALTIETPTGMPVASVALPGAAVPGCDATSSPGADVDGDVLLDRCDPDPNDGPSADADQDQIPNGTDNCPTIANADQTDVNANGFGDRCDPELGIDPTTSYRAAATGFSALSPVRVFDTRPGEPQGVVSVTKQRYGGGKVLRVKVAGVAGVPSSGVGAVSLNVTVAGPVGDGFVTVFPCGERPLAANLNYVTGQIVPNAVIAPVSADGEVCFYSLVDTHLIADINGWFAS